MSIYLALAVIWHTLVFSPSPQMLQGIVHGSSTSGGGSNTFTTVQNTAIPSPNGSSYTGPSGTGNIATIIFTSDTGSDFTISSISGGGTWVIPAGCHGGSGAIGFIACAYTLSTTAAATITITKSGASVTTASIWEYTPSGTAALDGVGTCTISSGNPINGCTPSLSGTNDVIVQGIALASAQASSVSVYGNMINHGGTVFSAEADLENSASTTPPSWTLTGASTGFGTLIAFK